MTDGSGRGKIGAIHQILSKNTFNLLTLHPTEKSTSSRLLSEPNVAELVNLLKDVVTPIEAHKLQINVNHQTTLLPSKHPKTARQRKKAKKRKNKTLTRKEYADLGLYTLPTKSIKYKDLLPLHSLWTEYVREFLSLNESSVLPDVSDANYDGFSKLLTKLDFHGARLTVTRSKCPSLVGIAGVVALDTKNTFKLCAEDNRLRSK